MADHLTEEEQVEALKTWWNDNWLSVVAPIVIFLFAYLGWNYWKDYKQEQAEAASVQYQQLLSLVDVAPGETISDKNKLSASEVAKSIIDEYPNGMYASLSSLLLAKFAAEAGDLDAAAAQIRTVVDSGANASISELAKIRLARVLAAQTKFDEALNLLVVAEGSSYKSLMAEVRGDIYVAQGQLALARTAYQESLDSLSMEQYARRGLIQVKFDNTAQPESESESAIVEAATDGQGDA